MAKHKAPTSLTGGKGFNFEDFVAARFLLDMLAGLRSIGPDYGRIIEVHWQVRDAGWLLDDLAITLEADETQRTVAMSVKSHRQVTQAGFPENFVTAAWEQWLGTESTVFVEGRDLLGLVTGKLANGVGEAWETLVTEATGTSRERMVARLRHDGDSKEKSQSSRIGRAIFSSMQCPKSLPSRGDADQNTTVDLIRHTRLWHFDFEDKPSRDEARAVSDCQQVLRSADANEAESLWEALLGIAAENRGQGGSITLPGLLQALRDRFALQDYPDHRSDWETIRYLSSDMESDIRTDVGELISLVRTQDSDDVSRALERDQACLLVGESGSGKSGLAKLVRLRHYPCVVWPPLTAIAAVAHLSEFHRQIGLTHPLSDLLKSSADRCLLVFDSIERYSDTSLRVVGRILRELHESQSDHVHVLLITQPDGVARAIEELSRLSGRVLPQPIVIGDPSNAEVLRIAAGVPNLTWATIHRDLLPHLKNLKVLDWVVRAAQVGAAPEDNEPVTLGRLIDFIWERWVERGEVGFTHGSMLQTLGDREAQNLSPGVPLAALDHEQSQALHELQHLDLIRVRSERVLFAHDLLGDWARLVLAREVQAQDEEGAWRGDDLERTTYEAALLAASDRPEEASALALELCRRRPLRPDIQQRADSARQEAERLRRTPQSSPTY